MTMSYDTKRRLRGALLPVICFTVVGYFSYHAVEGDRGLRAFSRLAADIEVTKLLLEDARSERQYLENKVNLLKTENIDPDMLEEQAHRILGMMRSDERLIYLNKQ